MIYWPFRRELYAVLQRKVLYLTVTTLSWVIWGVKRYHFIFTRGGTTSPRRRHQLPGLVEVDTTCNTAPSALGANDANLYMPDKTESTEPSEYVNPRDSSIRSAQVSESKNMVTNNLS